jgi:hypothetical protein
LDEHGSEVDSPPALSVATASGEAVFAPGGELEKTGRNINTPSPARTADAGVSDAAADAP